MRTTSMALFFLVIAFISNAQISVGGHAGYTRAFQYYGNVPLPEDGVRHIHGHNVSISINQRLSPFFSFGFEPGLTRRGAACVPGWNLQPNPIFRGDTRFKLDYLELPLHLQGHIAFGKGRFELSPSIGYSISSIVKGTREMVNLDTKEIIESGPLDIGRFSQIRRLDQGAIAGLRIARNIGRYQIYAKTSYYLGLRNVDRWNVSKNRALNVSIGYLFSLQ